jgi:hypothetical protein
MKERETEKTAQRGASQFVLIARYSHVMEKEMGRTCTMHGKEDRF